MAERIQALFERDSSYDFQHRVVRPSGEVRHVREHGRVVRDEAGAPLRVIGTVWDVTSEVAMQRQRDEAVKALADSEERHRLLAQNAWDVVWAMGLDGSIIFISPSVERVRGLTPAEAVAQSLDEIHPPESAARVTQYFMDLYAAIEAGTEPPHFFGEQEY